MRIHNRNSHDPLFAKMKIRAEGKANIQNIKFTKAGSEVFQLMERRTYPSVDRNSTFSVFVLVDSRNQWFRMPLNEHSELATKDVKLRDIISITCKCFETREKNGEDYTFPVLEFDWESPPEGYTIIGNRIDPTKYQAMKERLLK